MYGCACRAVLLNWRMNFPEAERYHRHLILEGVGPSGQARLKDSKVFVAGAGGLGCPVLLYLAAAGIGTLGIADDDTVHTSNLQRQVLFTEKEVGKNKATAAVFRLSERNSGVHYRTYPIRLESHNVRRIISEYDVVVDATDNFPSRYLLNDACVLEGKPLVHGSVLKFEGQVSVFSLTVEGRTSANYRDIFPLPPAPDTVPDCGTAGVLGVLPGIIGTLQANEVLKILLGIGDPLANKLLILDALSMEQRIISIRNRNSAENIKDLIDYDAFCGVTSSEINSKHSTQKIVMKEITVKDLQELKASGEDFQLIDVREPHEFDICDLGGELIPQGEIPGQVERISRDKKVVIHCRSGARSGNMVTWLEKNHGFTNLYNLKGGILAWAREIDPSMPTY